MSLFKEHHLSNSWVKENRFIGQNADKSELPIFKEVRNKLPIPFWEGNDSVIDCYWKAWEIAFSNLRQPTSENGFISPYIDTAFNDCLFMWDSSFIMLFGRYGIRAFDFQRTLDNFYAKQHKSGFICREIRESDGIDTFDCFDPASTGPNLLPWPEWEYYLNFGDRERLAKVFPALVAYYQWYRDHRSWPDGSYWSCGWGCGMDNQPRLPNRNTGDFFGHGFMSWVDISLQQIFVGKIFLEMAEVLNRSGEIKEIKDEIEKQTAYVNNVLWDPGKGFYFDRFRDGTLSNVMSIGGFWSLLADTLNETSLKQMVDHLRDPKTFNRPHRVPSLAASDADYDAGGKYWCGSIWAPTNYMVLRGLNKCKENALAHEIALNHVKCVTKVFEETGTLWENYAPERIERGDDSRKNFVGWTGLAPISVLFENVFGIRADVPNNTIHWDVRLLQEHGIQQYPFGRDGWVNLRCEARENVSEKPVISVESNQPINIQITLK
ncbi:MAG: glycoside hydrolase [Fibrobacteres bacterium]|nr:glycoside hydrolase [Fibrobacterota bacterium]